MKSHTTERFRKLFQALPKEVQQQTREAYRLFRHKPHHPSLGFKQLSGNIYSARITLDYRAVGIRDGDDMVWIWVGSHTDYDKLIAQLRRR